MASEVISGVIFFCISSHSSFSSQFSRSHAFSVFPLNPHFPFPNSPAYASVQIEMRMPGAFANSRPQEISVEPVVNTSSTSSTCFPATKSAFFKRKIPSTFSFLSIVLLRVCEALFTTLSTAPFITGIPVTLQMPLTI